MSASRNWRLTAQAFERLLDALDPDRDRAGEKYEALRSRLIQFFCWRGSPTPEEDADSTLDRVVRRLEQGEAIDRIEHYAHGVAKLVLLESLRRRERDHAGRELWLRAVPAPAAEAEARQACLDRCLAGLPADERALILEYYQGDGTSRIRGRQALAARLGLPSEQLRLRAHRIRHRLETCLCRCLGGPGGVRSGA
jgi:DNA-directed RNA polymerase specialized sigma24 family protein